MKRNKIFRCCVLGIIVLALLLTMVGCSNGEKPNSNENGNDPSSNNENVNNGNVNNGNVNNENPPSGDNGNGSEDETPGDGRTVGGDLVLTDNGSFSGFFTIMPSAGGNRWCWPALEPLAYLRVSDNTWKPALAESWEVDEENYTVTLHLRKGVTFHNGDPFNADDVVFSFEKRNDYGTANVIGNPVSVEKVDDYTVVVTFGEFSLYFEDNLLIQTVMSKETYEEMGEDWYSTHAIGTGPYMMSEFVPDDHITFVRYDDYWGEPGYVDTIEYRTLPDSTGEAATFLGGVSGRYQSSFNTTVTLVQAAGYTGTPVIGTSGSQQYMLPITIDPDDPLSNKLVRQAIYQYGVDWDSLAQTLGGELFYHTDAYGLPNFPYVKDDIEFTDGPDYEKAKELLAEAGYPNGFKTSAFYGNGGAATSGIATYVQAELAKIGIEMECVPLDYTVLYTEALTGKKTSGIIVTGTSYTTPQGRTLGTTNGPRGTYKVTGWTDKLIALDQAIPAAKTREEENEAMYAFVKEMMQEEFLYWPAYNARILEFYQDWCHFSDHAAAAGGYFDPHEIWVDAH